MWYFLLAVILVIIDQITKWQIVSKFKLDESISVIGDFFRITSHRNRGAAFGILQDQRWFFIIITIIVVIAIVAYMVYLIKHHKRLLPFALGMVLGGALGNFIDRARTGEVVDFFHFNFKFSFFGSPVDYHFPIFNVADSAIVVGMILVFLEALLSWNKERKENLQKKEWVSND